MRGKRGRRGVGLLNFSARTIDDKLEQERDSFFVVMAFCHIYYCLCADRHNATFVELVAVSSSRVQRARQLRARETDRQWQRSLQHLIYILTSVHGMKRKRSTASQLGISPSFFFVVISIVGFTVLVDTCDLNLY